MERVIRPFVGENIFPTPFIKPGSVGAPPVRIGPVGLPGGSKIFSYTASGTTTFYMVAIHREKSVSDMSKA